MFSCLSISFFMLFYLFYHAICFLPCPGLAAPQVCSLIAWRPSCSVPAAWTTKRQSPSNLSCQLHIMPNKTFVSLCTSATCPHMKASCYNRYDTLSCSSWVKTLLHLNIKCGQHQIANISDISLNVQFMKLFLLFRFTSCSVCIIFPQVLSSRLPPTDKIVIE